MKMETFSPCKLIFCISILLHVSVLIHGQQPYVNNRQLDCDNSAYNNITRGFVCSSVGSSCQSYVTFRSIPPYDSAVTIAYLLSAQADSIVSINQLTSATATVPTNEMLIIPVTCLCSGSNQSSYHQHNANYTVIYTGETYFSVSNNTYQGLTTCQAMMAQNVYGERNITKGDILTVPIRCACPSTSQEASGVKYLLNFLITWGDSIAAIAETFGVEEQSILDANELSSDQVIYPFTTVLVPLTTEPTKIESPVASSPPAPSPQTPTSPPGESSSSKKWVYVGVGIGVGLLLLIALLAFLFCFFRRRSKEPKSKPVSSSPRPKMVSESTDYTSLPENSKSWSASVSSQGFRSAVESLTIYKFQDLETATGNFSEENRIKGSVYRGSFKGDAAAVKVMKGDVSSEINILKKINHSNIIRLSGFCVHQGNTYLIYECADNGSLDDWLHGSKNQAASATLDWKKRVQIACDVANALNYLHKYTNPPYIHKNLKSSNILLDANFRAKIANFGLARSVGDQEEGGMQLTRHVIGTHGYLAPEYIENGVITAKLDVFAFGVVLLELLSGREALTGDKDKGEELLSASINKVLEGDNVREKFRGFMDPCLRNEYPLDLAFSVAQLAKNCVAHDLNSRPSMVEVFITLSKFLSSLLDWDPSDELYRSMSQGSVRDRS